jgi:tRNA uridine 5-carbamoylmethylation protein Kti12
MKTTVLLLVGLPGSGKSTLARHLCEFRRQSSHIEYDAISRSIDSRDSLDAWNQSRSIALEYLSTELRSLSSLVILDDNYHLKSMRKVVYRFCQDRVSEGSIIHFGVVYVNTPFRICMERNKLREGQHFVSDDVILKMQRSIEPPNESKAPWDAYNMQFDYTDDERFIKLHDFINHLEKGTPLSCYKLNHKEGKDILENLEFEREKTRQSKSHFHDQCLRKWVGFVSQIDKQKCNEANVARRHILEKLKTGIYSSLMPFVGPFCEEVCSGWNDVQIENLKLNLIKSMYPTLNSIMIQHCASCAMQ